MNTFRLLVAMLTVFGLANLVWFGAGTALLMSTLDVTEQMGIEAVLQPRFALVALAWLAGMGLAAATFRLLIDRYVSAPAQLVEETRLLLDSKTHQRLVRAEVLSCMTSRPRSTSWPCSATICAAVFHNRPKSQTTTCARKKTILLY